MTEAETKKLEEQAALAERRAAAEAKLAAVQPAWRIKEQQTQADYYARMNQAHDQAMQMRRARMAASPGSYNPWEKAGVDKYFADKAREEQRIADNEYRNKELDTKETVAGFESAGKTGYGRDAAAIKAEADKYTSDNQLKGVQSQAEAQREIEKGKLEAEKWIAGKKAESAETISKREHGYFDEDGTYNPGSDVHAAEKQGEWRSLLEQQRQEGKKEIEELKGKYGLQKEKMKGVLKAITEKIGGYNSNFKMEDVKEILKQNGLSEEEAKEMLDESGITLDEGKKQKEERKLSSTARTPAMMINRFA